jgi:hypothetical protein
MLTGETLRTREKNLSQCHFDTNTIWTDPGANPGLRGETLVTDSLNHGMAYTVS